MLKIVYQDYNKLSSPYIIQGLEEKGFRVKFYRNFSTLFDTKDKHPKNVDLYMIDMCVSYCNYSNKIKIMDDISKNTIPILFLTDPLQQCKKVLRHCMTNDMYFTTFKPLFMTDDLYKDVERAISIKRMILNAKRYDSWK